MKNISLWSDRPEAEIRVPDELAKEIGQFALACILVAREEGDTWIASIDITDVVKG